MKVLGEAADLVGADETAQALKNASTEVTREDERNAELLKKNGLEPRWEAGLQQEMQKTPEFIKDIGEGMIEGDFTEDNTFGVKIGQVIGGVIPIADIRDIIANSGKVIEGKPGAWIGLAGAAIGVIPIISDAGKIVFKVEKDVIAETAEKLIKNGVEKEAAEKIAKEEVEKLVKEAVEKQYDEIAKSGHAVQRHGESITERQLHERAINGVDPVTRTTDDAYNKFPDGTPRKHGYSKDATKFTNKESFVKSEIYIKILNNIKII